MNELASASPIVRAIVLRAIQVELRHLNVKERHVINTDLIPKFSDKNNTSDLQESSMHAPGMLPPLPKLPEEVLQQPVQIQLVQNAQQDYGKLTSLINDQNVAYIECFGKNSPLNVIRFGQKQRTNIVMNDEEIKSFLKYISDKVKIPLIDGVFNVVIDGMLVNAIVSDTIGTKFMIKKNYQIQQ
jgi:nitrogenase molybdenum-iron protein alpha/beta subunit